MTTASASVQSGVTSAPQPSGREFIYYVNGEFVPARQAHVALNDLGLVRGYGVFDLLRTYGRQPFALRAHLERLQRSAALIDLPLPHTIDEIEQIALETLARNDAENVSVRIVVTGGPSAGFLLPDGQSSLLVLIAPVKPSAARNYSEGAALITTDLPRFMPAVKSTNYISAVIGQQRAQKAGAVEALYRSADGMLTECTTSNFFVISGRQLITAEADVLPGITRAVVLQLAHGYLEIVQRPIAWAELPTVDEAFITSTTKEVMPIVRIDDVPIGSGKPGPHTQHLHRLFHEATRAG